MTTATVTDLTATSGYIRIQWNDTNPTNWRSWRIYSKVNGSNTWEILYETFTDAGTFDYHLYQFIVGQQADYSVVYTAQAGTDPLTVEPFNDVYSVTATGDDHFWLIDAVNSANNVKLEHVTNYPQTYDVDQATYHLIGRGRKLDMGDRLGYSGTMSGQFFDVPGHTARDQRVELENFRESSSAMFLRTPFGRTYQIQISSLQFTPFQGVGSNEYGNWSMRVVEVGGVPVGSSG